MLKSKKVQLVNPDYKCKQFPVGCKKEKIKPAFLIIPGPNFPLELVRVTILYKIL